MSLVYITLEQAIEAFAESISGYEAPHVNYAMGTAHCKRRFD